MATAIAKTNRITPFIALKTPVMDALWAKRPHTLIDASGLEVGLPDRQMGNSEVGHVNLGAGRIVYQDLTRLDVEIKERTFFANPVLDRRGR
ncbi:phosphoglyceromutase [Klebsiella pneumoniae subsp. ozaenae]|uniref:Phosphoglyceromutase n=1 Tax=Klebsiella pneumoniae subsp. ozaenae TaxID=574 RepID=A0A377YUK1_KLEPO|nr:phosphoglyceromutase [Klebsiella pneumoniae subsp. ozaenae]